MKTQFIHQKGQNIIKHNSFINGLFKNIFSESCDETHPNPKNQLKMRRKTLKQKHEVYKRPRLALNEQIWMRNSSNGHSKEAAIKK